MRLWVVHLLPALLLLGELGVEDARERVQRLGPLGVRGRAEATGGILIAAAATTATTATATATTTAATVIAGTTATTPATGAAHVPVDQVLDLQVDEIVVEILLGAQPPQIPLRCSQEPEIEMV